MHGGRDEELEIPMLGGGAWGEGSEGCEDAMGLQEFRWLSHDLIVRHGHQLVLLLILHGVHAHLVLPPMVPHNICEVGLLPCPRGVVQGEPVHSLVSQPQMVRLVDLAS